MDGRPGLRDRRRPVGVHGGGVSPRVPSTRTTAFAAEPPYGGVCLPKDTQGFLGFADKIGVDMPLLRAVVEVNDRLEALTGQELDSVVERNLSGADVA